MQLFISILLPFLKIGLTVAVLAFSENLLLEISLFVIFAILQSIMSAEILTNLAEIPSEPFALIIFRENFYIYYRENSLLIFWTLG